MKKFLVGVIVLVVAITFLKGCGNNRREANLKLRITEIQQEKQEKEEIIQVQEEKIQELQQELQNVKIEKERLEKRTESAIEKDENYLNVKFSSDGSYYKEAYDKVQFYSDSTCTIKLDNVRFMSAEIDYAQAGNGLNIYCLRLDSGIICYCTERPYLITEEKYNEIKSKQ